MISTTRMERIELSRMAELPETLAVREVVSVLAHLARDKSLLNYTPDMMFEQPKTDSPYIARLWRDSRDRYSVQLFVWPPHASSMIHDHSCWGAISSVAGCLVEERYTRLDNGAQQNQTHLKKAWTRHLIADDNANSVSTLLRYDGGIHRVSNPGGNTAYSLHIYGPAGAIDGRDYDPMYDYVCDRPPDDWGALANAKYEVCLA